MDEIGTQSIMLLLGLKLRAMGLNVTTTSNWSLPFSLRSRLRNLCRGNWVVVSLPPMMRAYWCRPLLFRVMWRATVRGPASLYLE